MVPLRQHHATGGQLQLARLGAGVGRLPIAPVLRPRRSSLYGRAVPRALHVGGAPRPILATPGMRRCPRLACFRESQPGTPPALDRGVTALRVLCRPRPARNAPAGPNSPPHRQPTRARKLAPTSERPRRPAPPQSS